MTKFYGYIHIKKVPIFLMKTPKYFLYIWKYNKNTEVEHTIHT